MRRTAIRMGTVMLGAAGLYLAGVPAEAAIVDVTTNITTSQTWTSNNDYVLTQVIYVTNGATLTIEPGTVIRAEGESSPGAHDPGTLVITRGSKLIAPGTAQAPIVFTDLLDDNVRGNPGTFPYDHLENALGLTGQWGGVILLGRGYVANNTLGAPNAAREVQIEGLDPAGGLGLYGNGGNDDDDSGTLSYISIRYGGFNLSANNEINGLTLGGVGRQTDIDYIEVFNPKDDGVECFGGMANLKHVLVANGGDDGLDYDEGYRGKVQFYAVLQGTPGADKSDKGGEWDGGNNPDGSQPFGLPTLYNLTFIGLGQKNYTNKLQNTAMHFRDNAGGRAYNSFFADFGGAPICIEGGSTLPTSALTSGERAITPYVIDPSFQPGPASDFQLELKNDSFWCFGNGGVVPTGDATASGCDAGKVHYDNGLFSNASLNNQYQDCVAALPIRALGRTSSGSAGTPDPVTSIDPRPAAGGVLTITSQAPPNDGFFEPAPYKGAFSPTTNWAAGWTNTAKLGYVAQCSPSALSSVPDESNGVVFGGPFGTDPTRLTWNAPPSSDGPLFYDLLRANSPSSFASALCVETDDIDTSANDASQPSPGTALYYLVRAGNACGEGSLGAGSNGTPRTGPSCP